MRALVQDPAANVGIIGNAIIDNTSVAGVDIVLNDVTVSEGVRCNVGHTGRNHEDLYIGSSKGFGLNTLQTSGQVHDLAAVLRAAGVAITNVVLVHIMPCFDRVTIFARGSTLPVRTFRRMIAAESIVSCTVVFHAAVFANRPVLSTVGEELNIVMSHSRYDDAVLCCTLAANIADVMIIGTECVML